MPLKAFNCRIDEDRWRLYSEQTAACRAKQHMPELSILSPDGKSITFPLLTNRISLGRSRSNELCYPEDIGLSRQHLVLERDGESWVVIDPGSKNGTLVNGQPVLHRRRLRSGDRIRAGHLTIVFDAPEKAVMNDTVVFFGGHESPKQQTAILSTNLDNLIAEDGLGPAGKEAAVAVDRIGALIRAGRELASHRPLDQLFELILDLSIEAVAADRGVLLTVEPDGAELRVRAARGRSFQISSGVRDRVLKEKQSVLVNDVFSDENFVPWKVSYSMMCGCSWPSRCKRAIGLSDSSTWIILRSSAHSPLRTSTS